MDLIALAAQDLERPLEEEVGARVIGRHERLFVLEGVDRPVWAQNVWLAPQSVQFSSINEAAQVLRSVQRNWRLHSVAAHRRARLIEEALPPIKSKKLTFPVAAPTAPLGAFTLFDEKTLVYSPSCSSPFPDGAVEFIEDKEGPPSRAYLKLWEMFSLLRRWPGPGVRVLDLGSSPGGWTWVLDQLGCDVVSVDKAPLERPFSPRVQYVPESAFALKPERYDWLFSDIVCYPERLLELVRKWEPHVANMVCTLKFQGPTNFAVIEEFRRIPGSHLVHLYNNKHELTWYRLQ